MSKVAAGAAKRVAGDVVTCVFEVRDMGVGLGLHKVALTEPHVALNGKDITLEGSELGLRPQEGVAKIAHADNLGVQAGMACGPHGVAEESVAHCGPKKEVSEPSRESSDALALLGVPWLSIDLEDPRVLAGGLTKVVTEDVAVLEFFDPVSDAETAVVRMDKEIGVLIIIDTVPWG
jgi:hypothetical protein